MKVIFSLVVDGQDELYNSSERRRPMNMIVISPAYSNITIRPLK
jgi:hypothetical protein